MFARPFAAFVLLALCALLGGILGCLRVFGPDLRARGVHASVPTEPASDPTQIAGACMSCHEAEADALARMQAAKPAPHAHGGELHTHEPEPTPMTTPMTGPPLVADWMVADSRSCTDCHRVRP